MKSPWNLITKQHHQCLNRQRDRTRIAVRLTRICRANVGTARSPGRLQKGLLCSPPHGANGRWEQTKTKIEVADSRLATLCVNPSIPKRVYVHVGFRDCDSGDHRRAHSDDRFRTDPLSSDNGTGGYPCATSWSDVAWYASYGHVRLSWSSVESNGSTRVPCLLVPQDTILTCR